MNPRRKERARVGASLRAPPRTRFTWPERPLARLPRLSALALLALVALALAWSALGTRAPADPPLYRSPSTRTPIADLALHARIAERVRAGEDYYRTAPAEQRDAGEAPRSSLTVRLPTLTWLNARLGRGVMGLVAALLLIANLFAWHRALALRTTAPERIAAMPLLLLAGFAVMEPHAGLAHELVAGLLLSLSLALYRPGFAAPALLTLAAALAIRELAAPFALAWLALALVEKRWKEAGALALLLALFAAALALHRQAIAALLTPTDYAALGWSGLEGPALFTSALAAFTPLTYLAHWLAGPSALLPLVGWIGLGGRLGALATLWFAGFALLMVLLARATDLVWVLMILPAYAAGLAFVPRALADVARAARIKAPLASAARGR